jgi:hypothetical protein
MGWQNWAGDYDPARFDLTAASALPSRDAGQKPYS